MKSDREIYGCIRLANINDEMEGKRGRRGRRGYAGKMVRQKGRGAVMTRASGKK